MTVLGYALVTGAVGFLLFVLSLTEKKTRRNSILTMLFFVAAYSLYRLFFDPPTNEWSLHGLIVVGTLALLVDILMVAPTKRSGLLFLWRGYLAMFVLAGAVWIWMMGLTLPENTKRLQWILGGLGGVFVLLVIITSFSTVRHRIRYQQILSDKTTATPRRSRLAVGVGILSFLFGVGIFVLYYYGELWLGPNWTLAYNLPHFLKIAWEWPVKIEPVPFNTTFFSALAFMLGGVILIIRDEPQTMRGWLLLAAVVGLLFFAYQNIPHEAFWWLLGYYILIVTPLWAANAKNSVPKSSSA